MSRLLDQALALPEPARQGWLESLPPEHREVLPMLAAALLASEAQTSDPGALLTLPRLPDKEKGNPPSGLTPGDRVGPYELVRPLGAGGMAEVWLARRVDGAFKRELALKLPLLTRSRRDLEERFARERDILASLEHPNIARLYDAGIDAQGLPFLAMEYVAGEPITGWCDAHRLPISERLTLFLQVLASVRYAHERQIVHRDLKPSNILVTEAGEIRLLDFGVAKLLEAGPAEQCGVTGVHGLPLTPDYASPELLTGGQPDARSDIYSLGVLLYELLAGARPYSLNTGGSLARLAETLDTITVARPSTRVPPEAGKTRGVSGAKLTHALQGDLDAIALKALARQPEDRYRNVAAFAADLQSYLEGRPVAARLPGFTDHARKLLVRHRGAVVAALAAGALAVVLAYAWPRGARTTAVARAAATSIAVLPFVDMSEQHDEEYFSDGLSEELIDRLARSAGLTVTARTSSFAFKGKSQDVRAIGAQLGVANVLEGSVRQAGRRLRITTQLVRTSDGAHLWSETYERDAADIFRTQSDIATAVAAALDVVLKDSRARVAAATPEAYNLLLKGDYFFVRLGPGDLNRSVESYRAALALEPRYALAWARLERSYVWLALWDELPPPEAEAKARDAAQHALAIEPALSTAHRWLGKMYVTFDADWPGARREFEQAAALDPGGAEGQLARIDLLTLTGEMHGDFGELLQLVRSRAARDPLSAEEQRKLALVQYLAGRYAESAASLRQLMELRPDYPEIRATLAQDLLLAGSAMEAVKVAEKESSERARLAILASIYYTLGREGDADAALRALEKGYGEDDPYDVAQAYGWRGDAAGAAPWLERAYRIHDAQLVALRVDGLLRPIRASAEYRAMAAKLGLADD